MRSRAGSPRKEPRPAAMAGCDFLALLAAHCMDSRRAGGVRPGRQEAVCRHWLYASDTAPNVYACVTDTVGEQAELEG